MSKSDYYLELDVPMQIPGEPNKYMNMNVYYSLGGTNYFSGGQEARGVYVSFTPVTVDGYMRSFLLMTPDSAKLCLEQLPRKNKKRGEHWASAVKERQHLLLQCAAARNWQGIYQVLKHGNYTPDGWLYRPGTHRDHLGLLIQWFDVADPADLLTQADVGYARTAGIGFSHLDLKWELKELPDGSTTLRGSREDPPMRELARFRKGEQEAILYDYEFMAIRGVQDQPVVCRVD